MRRKLLFLALVLLIVFVLSATSAGYGQDKSQISVKNGAVTGTGVVVITAKEGSKSIELQCNKSVHDCTILELRRWRFEPARKDGVPVAVQTDVEVNFRLY
jgi:hypothetical protein